MTDIETITTTGQRVTHAYSYFWTDWKICPSSPFLDGGTVVDVVGEVLEDLGGNFTFYRVDDESADVCYLVTTNPALKKEQAKQIYQQLAVDEDSDDT